MLPLRLAAIALIYAAQRGSEAIGRACAVNAHRRLEYDPRPWALTEPRRVDESPDLLIDDPDGIWNEYSMSEVIRCGPVVLAADWCPDGRGRWIVLRADREHPDALALLAAWEAQQAAHDTTVW